MCDCISRLPNELRSTVSHALQRHGGRSIYFACASIEPVLSRPVFHRILRWADSLAGCPECGPRLNSRP